MIFVPFRAPHAGEAGPGLAWPLGDDVYVYVYIYIYMYYKYTSYIHIYIYIYVEREREREREIHTSNMSTYVASRRHLRPRAGPVQDIRLRSGPAESTYMLV